MITSQVSLPSEYISLLYTNTYANYEKLKEG
jgi:hypothetical protein